MPDSHVPGVMACTGPYAWRFSMPLTIVRRCLNGMSGWRILPSCTRLPAARGVHSLMIAPCGKYTNSIRGVALAAVAASAVPAGSMASNSGSAIVAPMPRRNVRRFRCFFEMNMAPLRSVTYRCGIGRQRAIRREPHLLRRDELEEHRFAFSGRPDAVDDRMDDLFGLGDALAIATHGLGEIRIVARDVARAVLLV